MQKNIFILRNLITHTLDGEWGKEDWEEGLTPMRVIRGTDFHSVSRGDLSSCPVRQINLKAAGRKKLEAGDIIIETAGGSRDRPTGRTLFITQKVIESSDLPLTCASFARFLRFEDSLVDSSYLYWHLQNQYKKGLLESYQVQHTGVARFQFTSFANSHEISLPDLNKQLKISSILSKIEDKIEINQQMNRTLEQMARALFKSWFIDFDPVRAKQRGEQPVGMDAETAALFPDRFIEIDGKEVPEGWEITSIGELTESIFSGGTPDTRKPEYWNGAIPWFSSGETRNSFIIKTEKTITPAGVENSSTRPIRKKDILIASAGQGFTRGQTSFNVIDAYINQSVVAIRTNLKKVSPEWLYINISGRYEEMRGLSDGHSSRGSLTTKIIALLPVALAPQKIIGAYTEVVEGLIERQVNNMHEIDQLASLRDSLLPRLLSGELDVSDWENAVEVPECSSA